MNRPAQETWRRTRWYVERIKLAAPYLISLVAIDAIVMLVYDRFSAADLLSRPIIIHSLDLLAGSLISLAFISLSSNRDLPATFACRIILYVFGLLMIIVVLSRSFYSITLTGLACLTTCIIGSMLSIQLAKFHGDKALWIGDDADAERKASLGEGVYNLTDPESSGDYDIIVVAHTKDRAKAAAVTKAYMLEREIIAFSSFYEYRFGRVYLPDFQPDILSHSFNQRIYIVAKRLCDVIFCVLCSPLILALCGFTAIYILIASGRPIFFRQERVGFGGSTFQILKFRTMGSMPAELKTTTTQIGDSRIIKGGHFLRRFRLDEIPQFWHILTGQMSLIGPRPEWSVLVERYSPLIPEYSYRHIVRPGLSGWAQVKLGYASDIDETRSKISYDLYYVRHISLELDLRILLKTIRALLWKSGAR